MLPSATSSVSNLSDERPTETGTNSQREPLKERDEINVASSHSRRNSDQNDDVSSPPSKKSNNMRTGDDRKQDKGSSHKSQTHPKTTSKFAREKSNKSSLLSNHVDVDLDTMCMAFSSKFEELVTKSGFKLQDGEEPFLLSESSVSVHFDLYSQSI